MISFGFIINEHQILIVVQICFIWRITPQLSLSKIKRRYCHNSKQLPLIPEGWIIGNSWYPIPIPSSNNRPYIFRFLLNYYDFLLKFFTDELLNTFRIMIITKPRYFYTLYKANFHSTAWARKFYCLLLNASIAPDFINF